MDLTLVGAGRHPKTLQKRRAALHPRRTFWIGGHHMGSGRKVRVTLAWCTQYFAELCVRIKNGTLILQRKHDSFIDCAELEALCFGAAPTDETSDPEVLGDAPVELGAPDELVPEGDPFAAVDAAETTDPEELPIAALPVEPATEAPVEPEAAAEPAEPVLDATAAPEAAAEPQEAPLPELPEGWRLLTKKELVALAASRGLVVPEPVPSNKALIALLETP